MVFVVKRGFLAMSNDDHNTSGKTPTHYQHALLPSITRSQDEVGDTIVR